MQVDGLGFCRLLWLRRVDEVDCCLTVAGFGPSLCSNTSTESV
jgi:hypothetical protein